MGINNPKEKGLQKYFLMGINNPKEKGSAKYSF
jgi:hypothetical protein